MPTVSWTWAPEAGDSLSKASEPLAIWLLRPRGSEARSAPRAAGVRCENRGVFEGGPSGHLERGGHATTSAASCLPQVRHVSPSPYNKTYIYFSRSRTSPQAAARISFPEEEPDGSASAPLSRAGSTACSASCSC